jgi:COMPASS component SWD3
VGWRGGDGAHWECGRADVSSRAKYPYRRRAELGRRLWDASTGQCLKTLDNDSNAPVTSAFFTPNPFYLVSGTQGVVRVYNIHTGKVVKTLRSTTAAPVLTASTATTATTESKDNSGGPVVVTITSALSSRGGCEEDVDMENHDSITRKTGAWIIATSGEMGAAGGKVSIWDLATRRILQMLDRHQGQVVALAVHPTGRLIATGSVEPEKIIHIWRDDE